MDIDSNKSRIAHSSKDILQLVTDKFAELGFTDENPEDLKLVAHLVELHLEDSPLLKNVSDLEPALQTLLNDEDVIKVISLCMKYFEPKKHLSKNDLKTILEEIATGKLKRQGWDYKQSCPVEEEPSFRRTYHSN